MPVRSRSLAPFCRMIKVHMFSYISPDRLWPRLLSYIALILLFVITFNLAFDYGFNLYKQGVFSVGSGRHPGAGTLTDKRDYYLSHKNEFNTLILGDSRTLCGMHPDLIDQYWDRNSFNLAHWAVWFPAQYALISDIAADIPQDTLIVWSIGHQNFSRADLKPVYPPGWQRLARYKGWHYKLSEFVPIQMSYFPLTSLIGRRDIIYDKIQTVFKRPVIKAATAQTDQKKPAPTVMQDIADQDITGYVRQWFDDDGNLASVAQYKINGAMARTEINPAFYRHKQQKIMTSDGRHFSDFVQDKANREMFIAILDIFKEHGLRVIVNEFEETPYTYPDDKERQKFRNFMRSPIKDIVESYGYDYVHVDFDHLQDADYFDYNHLNSKGIAKFSAMLGPQLQDLTKELAGQK